jgi:hypothetical protein
MQLERESQLKVWGKKVVRGRRKPANNVGCCYLEHETRYCASDGGQIKRVSEAFEYLS